MKIVGFASENMASSYLRVEQWVRAMSRLGHKADFYPNGLDQLDKYDERVHHASVVIYGHTHDHRKMAIVHAGKNVHRYKIVCDTDDLFTDIPTYNFAARAYSAATQFKRLGELQMQWADLVTVSTDELGAAMRTYNENVMVVPNVVDERLYSGVKTRPKEAHHEGDLRIYWGGGGGHYDDLLVVKDALLAIFHKHANVKLVFSNFVPDWAASLDPLRVFFMPLVPFATYPKPLRWWNIDIGLAPLVDNRFNHCKSHIKYLDYSMAGIAGVYQDSPAYASVRRKSIYEPLTGLMATDSDSWYKAIDTLVTDSSMRKSIADAAKSDVLAKWNLDDWDSKYDIMLKKLVGADCVVPVSELIEGEPPMLMEMANNA